MQFGNPDFAVSAAETELLDLERPLLLVVEGDGVHEIAIIELDDVRVLHLKNGRLLARQLDGLELETAFDTLHDVVFSDVFVDHVAPANEDLHFLRNEHFFLEHFDRRTQLVVDLHAQLLLAEQILHVADHALINDVAVLGLC